MNKRNQDAQQIFALFIALCKIYDNYITPLQSRVKCWKWKLNPNDDLYDEMFLLGMTITEFTGPVTYISYYLPLYYWDKINVIELLYEPETEALPEGSDKIIERLLAL